MELREKLKEALNYERYALDCPNGTEDAIDRILAIPELAEALAIRKGKLEQSMRSWNP